MGIIIGVEGGGTYTRAAVLSLESLDIISYAQGGPSNYHNIGIKKTIRNIHSTVKIALKSVEVSEYSIKHMTLGLPAMNSIYDVRKLRRAIKRIFPGLNINLEHDVHIALYGVTRGRPGILVVAGTGCNVYGYSYGKRYYAGNWGWKVGDEGSAYKIGITTLNLALKEYDKRIHSTGILKEVLNYLKLPNIEKLIYWVNKAGVEQIANISVLACKLSESNSLLYKVISNAARELAKSVYAVKKRMGIHKINLYYTGGLFNCKTFRNEFLRLVSRLRGLRVKKLDIHPLIGAILISLDTLGIEADPKFLNKKLVSLLNPY